MSHTKLVNGEAVPLTAKEEAEFTAREQAFLKEVAVPEEPPEMDVLRRALEAKGLLTEADLRAAKEEMMSRS